MAKNREEIIKWTEDIWIKNSKIQRLNIVRLRPEQYPLFIKGAFNTAFVFSSRNRELDQLVEGEDLLACSIKTEDINQDDLNYIEKFIEKHNGGNAVFSSLVVFFKQDEVGIFLIEQRK